MNIKKFLFDHELAAFAGFKDVFNRDDDRAKSCYFHFSQNLIKKLGETGLKLWLDFPIVQKFIRQLQGILNII